MMNKGRGAMRGQPLSSKALKNLNRQTIQRLMQYISKYKLPFIAVAVCIIISSVASVVASRFLQTLIDDYIEPLLLQPVPNFSGLSRMLCLMAAVYLAGVLATLLYNRIMAVIAQGTLKEIRDDMFAHMQTLPIKYFDTHTFGDIMSHFTNDTDTLRQMISQSIPQVFASAISVIAVFCTMLSISVWLTLVVLLATALILRITAKIAGNSGKYFIAQQTSLADVNGYIEEMMNGQKVVKVFCHEEKAMEEFNRRNDELCDNATRANSYANILGPVNNNMGHLMYAVLAIIGGAMAIVGVPNLSFSGMGVLTLGGIAAFLQLSRNFIQPISQVSQQLNSVVMAMAGAERIFQLMDEKSEEDHGYVTLVNARREKDGTLTETKEKTGVWAWRHPHHDGAVTLTELRGDVRLANVDFAYEEGKEVLHDVTVWAEPGQKVAFVGATGAGKTTITNLINRFYDIADGKIRYDGINITKIQKPSLRRSLGVVLQDVNLFTGTVMENIRYGRLDATDEECKAAARLVHADGFIEMLPEGYNTVLSGDGSGLSQGQRQLISIARAAVADPPVMILDEATSSIDTRTESLVQKGMDNLMKGRTVFVIAHRLSTVQNSDVIMVLDHGRIIERGSHDELIAKKGTYYRLYTGAFELE